MPAEFWTLLAWGLAVPVALMLLVWIIARFIDNAGIVDIAWSYGFALVAGTYCVLGRGDPARRSLIAFMAIAWSLRLGTYLYFRVMGHHPEEDGRYRALRDQFPRHTWLMFFGFFQLQAVLITVLSLPFLLVSIDPVPGIGVAGWIGFSIWLVAIVGEASADHQLATFRRDPANRGRTCRVGLWGASRHPNYFFQWLLWVGFFVFALGSPWGWVTIYCPLLMLFFLLRVTGIPATEAHALESRGEEYRRYQRTTSAFIPWFPKR